MSELGEYYRSLDEVKSERTKKRLRSRMNGVRKSTTPKIERSEEIRRIAEEGKTRLAQPVELSPGNPKPLGHKLRPEFLEGLRRKS